MNRLGGVTLGVQVEVHQSLLNHTELVITIKDYKIRFKGQVLSFTAQDARTGGVECA